MNARNEVERSLLACAVMDPSVIDMYGARISHRDWWRPQHAALWAKLRELRDDARYANLDQGWFDVVVGEAFSWGEAVNGGAYVAALPQSAPSPEAAGYYVARITKASLRQSALDLLARTAEQLKDGADPDAALAAFDAASAELTHRDAIDRPDWVRIGTTAAEVYDLTHEMQREPGALARLVVRSPWPGLDDRIGGGFRPGQVSILAGRPATGKTAAAMQIAAAVADAGKGVGVFSMEMARADLTLREYARTGMIRLDGLLRADLSRQEWVAMSGALEAMDRRPMWVDDSPALHVVELRRRARKLAGIAAVADAPLGLLVVDYMQLATARNSRSESREQEVATISRALLAIAKELRVPVLALAQMNRSIEERAAPKPRMADLRESGQIEQDAQNIIFTHRDMDEPDEDVRQLVVAKARSGQPGDVEMRWHGRFQLMEQAGAKPTDSRPKPRELDRWQDRK